MNKDYDIAILGGGLAGLSLLYHLIKQDKLARRRVQLVDPEGAKGGHDRTWSFWEREAGPFEEIVEHRWRKVTLHNNRQDVETDLGEYTYKIIRSPAFYAHVNAVIDACPNVTRLKGRAENITSTDVGVTYQVGEEVYHSPLAFSSLPLHLRPRQISQPYLDQHFRGWFIETGQPIFDPAVATLMDFRTEQHGETRFLYVLPLSPTYALVEVAIFSNDHLRAEEYDEILRDYLKGHWTGDYRIDHVEAGNIPMTTYPFEARDRNLIYIGMRGGATRPSTGYTFWALQRQLERMARNFPDVITVPVWPRRHVAYDATVLHILERQQIPGDELFVDLFAKNPAGRVLAFLNGESGLGQELALMGSTRIGVFGPAFVRELF